MLGMLQKRRNKIKVIREITRDKIPSITEKGELVGIYYADTDGSVAIKELPVKEDDEYIGCYKAAAKLLATILVNLNEQSLALIKLKFLNRNDTY